MELSRNCLISCGDRHKTDMSEGAEKCWNDAEYWGFWELVGGGLKFVETFFRQGCHTCFSRMLSTTP